MVHYDHYIAITISFNQSTYHVNENDMTVEIVAILSNPSSTDITVEVTSNDTTATSEFTTAYYTYIYVYFVTQQPSDTHIRNMYITYTLYRTHKQTQTHMHNAIHINRYTKLHYINL